MATAIDVDIPVVRDAETQGEGYPYNWSREEMQTIQDHKQYHLDMHDYLEDLEYYGPFRNKTKETKK